jgi:hypothetical protein
LAATFDTVTATASSIIDLDGRGGDVERLAAVSPVISYCFLFFA